MNDDIKLQGKDPLHEKLDALRAYIKEQKSVAVAFSSGVDSTFLLKVAHDVLGDDAVAVTAVSGAFPARETREAQEFCSEYGIRQLVFRFDELSVPGFARNPENRCYLCKKTLFSGMKELALKNGFREVLEGSNMDDTGDYRPGLKAISELGILSPLRHAGLYKSEIRALSKEMGLPTWQKQSYACLASRFVYGEQITREKLSMVEKAEDLLLKMNFVQLRVRIHNNLARIEVFPEEFGRLIEARQEIVSKFKEYGFAYVTMDLQGYRTGSMNETLDRTVLEKVKENSDDNT